MTRRTSAPSVTRRRGALLGGTVGLAVLAVLSVFVGTRSLAPSDVWQAITEFDAANGAHLVVTELRLPRTALAILVGAALGVAGTIMQALTRNPLAEPGILGVNAGAAAATATGIGLFGGTLGTFGLIAFSFVGAALASVAVAGLGGIFRRGADPVRLVLAGAALAVTLGAYTQALLINYPEVFDTFRHWAVGSVQGRDGALVLPATLLIVPAVVMAALLGSRFNASALGTDLGRTLGADPRRTLWTGAVLLVVLAGTATAVAGPIAFVGLTAPLAVRLLVGPDYRWIIPLSAVYAAVLVLGADIIGRILLPPTELETSIVTALIGAPVFVLLARRRRLMRL